MLSAPISRQPKIIPIHDGHTKYAGQNNSSELNLNTVREHMTAVHSRSMRYASVVTNKHQMGISEIWKQKQKYVDRLSHGHHDVKKNQHYSICLFSKTITTTIYEKQLRQHQLSFCALI